MKNRLSWEQTRLISYWSASALMPHLKKGKELRMTDIMPFHWDAKPKKSKVFTREEVMRLAKEKMKMNLSENLKNELDG